MANEEETLDSFNLAVQHSANSSLCIIKTASHYRARKVSDCVAKGRTQGSGYFLLLWITFQSACCMMDARMPQI